DGQPLGLDEVPRVGGDFVELVLKVGHLALYLMPFMPLSMPMARRWSIPPLPTPLNIFRICAYWRSSWFTSCTVVPDPLAIRFRRLPEMISWWFRSFCVIELMIASMRTNCFSSTCPAMLHAAERP